MPPLELILCPFWSFQPCLPLSIRKMNCSPPPPPPFFFLDLPSTVSLHHFLLINTLGMLPVILGQNLTLHDGVIRSSGFLSYSAPFHRKKKDSIYKTGLGSNFEVKQVSSERFCFSTLKHFVKAF